MYRRKKYIKYTLAQLKSYIADEGTCVHKIHAKKHLGLPLSGLADLKNTIEAELDHKIGRMDRVLDGIVLDIRNIKVYNEPVFIHSDNPDLHLDYEANFYVFQPRIGAVVKGIVKHIGRHHLGVLIYRVFNVAVTLGRANRNKIKVNQKIKLRIVNFDLTSSLPEIEGELDGDEYDVDSGIGADDNKEGLALVKQEPKTDDDDDSSPSEKVPPPKPILKVTKGKKTKKKEQAQPKTNKRVSFLDDSVDIKEEAVSSDQDRDSPTLDGTTTFDDFERSVNMFSTQLPLNVSVKDEPTSSSQEQSFSSATVREKSYKKHKENTEEKTRKRKATEALQEEEVVEAFKEPPRKKKKKRDEVAEENLESVERVKVKRERSSTPEVSIKKVKMKKIVIDEEQTTEDTDSGHKKKKKKKKKRKDSEADLDISIANIFDEVESVAAEIRVKREKD